MTITFSCSNSWNHLVWWGRIAEWSMSGLVTTTCPALRMADRIGRRRVPVVAGGRDLQPGVPDQLRELRDLVLAQRLGRKQEQRPRGRILRQRLQHRHRVAEGLPGRRRRHHDDVLAGVDALDGIRLVRVRPLDAPLRETGADPRVQPLGPVRVDRLACGPDLVVDDAPGERRLLEQPLEDGEGGGGGVGAHAGLPVAETERMIDISRSIRHAG